MTLILLEQFGEQYTFVTFKTFGSLLTQNSSWEQQNYENEENLFIINSEI